MGEINEFFPIEKFVVFFNLLSPHLARTGIMAQEKLDATVHLFCGLPTSGKTTFAKELAQNHKAIRFSLDEWMIDLTDATIFDAEYGEMAEKLQELFWQTAVPLLQQGTDVILDWSLWNRERRQKWIGRITELGADYTLYYLNIPPVVLRQRLEKRNAELPPGVHPIPCCRTGSLHSYV
jgi:predicted kinase